MSETIQAPDQDEGPKPLLTRIVELFLRGDVAILFVMISLMLGLAALLLTPREEEPQIVVPMADVFITAPGLSAEEVEQQVTRPIEKLLYQIDGVEYVYSMSRPGQSVVTVRFYVSEDREDSLVKLYNKIQSNVDQIPPVVESWVVKPIEVDDVPIVIATLWSDQTELYGDHELRRIAEEVQQELQAIPNTNQVWITGGRPRQIRVQLDAQRLAGRQTSALQVAAALRSSNVNQTVGQFTQQDQQFIVQSGTFIRHSEDLALLVVNVVGNRPVYLKDVADILDGPAEVDDYSWIGFGPDDARFESHPDIYPAVHIAVAKRKGTNAVWVSNAVKQRLSDLSASHLPDGVHYRITRDYGETANEKVNELVNGLIVAVITVVALIGLTMGWRPALVIALAIPVCYSLTLFVNLLAGYTINRVTLFALILSLGLLVDDPITNVENIARYFSMRMYSARQSVLRAVQEVQPALILSTLAIIASFLPLFFITGMMGPYMGPMALNVPLTVTISTLVALMITPWMAMVALRKMLEVGTDEPPPDVTQQPLYRMSRAILGPIVDHRWLAWAVVAGVALLLVAVMILPITRSVPLKMLPYDNKNEFQIIVDMPEGTTLDRTDAVARRLAAAVAAEPEVRDYQVYVGLSSPMDFNGMVRHYFLRKGSHVADIRINLAPKQRRVQQSHEILLRLRQQLAALSEQLGANIKLVEVPPGPPVLATLTGEIYGPAGSDYDRLIDAGRIVQSRLAREPGVVDVDSSIEDDQVRWVFETDKPKAALSGVSTERIAQTLAASLGGLPATVLHLPNEVEPLWVELRLPREKRSAIDDLEELYVQGENGQLVQLGGLGRFVRQIEDKTIYHKNLQRVVYVYGEIAGRPPADVIVDIQTDQRSGAVDAGAQAVRPAEKRTWITPGGNDLWNIPDDLRVSWAGEGEWKITLDVFRDLGLAFGAALLGIFVILMFQTGSRVLPMLIMLAIPLTLIGILPGFWLLNALFSTPVGGYPNPTFFTATAMIGMIALGGIVVRNSVVLIDFINNALAEGLSLREAIIRSVAVRTRPILLTAGTTLLANWVITLDPVFSGLAWAIIFGIITSTLFTLLVIPSVYWLIFGVRTAE
ncbi:MAG: efflux RND transporter permease subunit [bacterium]|nr:efflux RND transporter permease subunit [bacterium]